MTIGLHFNTVWPGTIWLISECVVPVLQLTCCVTLGKSLPLSELDFPNSKMRESDLPLRPSLGATSQDSVPRAGFPTAKEDGVLVSHSDFLGRLTLIKCFRAGS